MRYALVDERLPKPALRGLLLYGVAPILLPRDSRLSEPISSHPDILCFVHGKNIITNKEYYESQYEVFNSVKTHTGANIILTDEKLSGEYPHDAMLNALVIEDKIFLKTDTASCAVMQYAKDSVLKIYHTNQGYPACTTLAFKGSAITADEGMARVLCDAGVKTTLISNGDISLPPYEYGFIGGACGVTDKEVFFIGDINLHRDSEKIKKAITDEGLAPISLSWEKLGDFGRILFIP